MGKEVSSQAKGSKSEAFAGESSGSFRRGDRGFEIREQSSRRSESAPGSLLRRGAQTWADLRFHCQDPGISPSTVSKSIIRAQQALGCEAIEEHLLESQ